MLRETKNNVEKMDRMTEGIGEFRLINYISSILLCILFTKYLLPWIVSI